MDGARAKAKYRFPKPEPKGRIFKAVQLYRFHVATADGRESVSAVALVDPNASD